MDNQLIEKLLGQSEAISIITRDRRSSANYLISAPSGGGKHYLMNQLADFFAHQTQFRVFRCRAGRSGIDANMDFAPFNELLAKEENTSQINLVNASRPFVELIPHIGKCISSLMALKKTYPAVFNGIESELLARIEHVAKESSLVFLCEEIDCWDRASICFLQKLMRFTFAGKVCVFVCSAVEQKTELPIESSQFDYCFSLRNIPENQVETVSKILFPGTKFSPEVLRQLYILSGGNIGMIIQLTELLQRNMKNPISKHLALRDVIQHRLLESLGQSRYENAVELLDRASLIGEHIYRALLAHFLHFDSSTFIESVDDVVRHNILEERADFFDFSYRIIWESFYEYNRKNKRFHRELANSICELMPSNYSYISDEMSKAGEEQEAAIYCILSALKEYHLYRSRPILTQYQTELLQKRDLSSAYQSLIELYSYIFTGNYLEAQQMICRYPDLRLSFEADYIRAVGKINGSIMQSAYSEALTTLQGWIEDEEFRRQSPYQWMRAAILAIGAQYELHDQSMVDLLKKVEKVKRRYEATDQGMAWLEYDFLSKCNFCYTIDTAYNYTKEALEFFRKNVAYSPSKYPYYVALINCGANSTVMGKYQEATAILEEAMELVGQEGVSRGGVGSLINNLLIAELLGNQMRTPEEIQLAINQMDALIGAASDDTISSILLRNNQIVMQCYMGDMDAAAKKIEALYNEIRYTEGVDDYYLYISGNNYHIIRQLAGIAPIDLSAMEEIFYLRPLDNDHEYFATRQRIILEQLKLGRFPDPSIQGWNDLSAPRVGPAWSFWGKWLLFSDLQIWSN